MITQEMMKKFCAKEDPREYLKTILRRDGYLYASTGHILISIKDDPEFNAEPLTTSNFELVIKRDLWPEDGFIKFEIPEYQKKKCLDCVGTGEVKKREDWEDCEECDGYGWFKFGSHEYDCKECDGTGESCEYTGAMVTCNICAGYGNVPNDVRLPDGKLFNSNYLELIALLPNPVYLPCSEKEHAMKFKFDDGLGMLMPLRDRNYG